MGADHTNDGAWEMLTPSEIIDAWKASIAQAESITALVNRIGDILEKDAVSRELAAKMQHERINREREVEALRRDMFKTVVLAAKFIGAGLAALAAPLAMHLGVMP